MMETELNPNLEVGGLALPFRVFPEHVVLFHFMIQPRVDHSYQRIVNSQIESKQAEESARHDSLK